MGARLTLDYPPNPQEGCQHPSSAGARPSAHAALKEMLSNSGPVSPCSSRSAITRSASAWTLETAVSCVSPYARTLDLDLEGDQELIASGSAVYDDGALIRLVGSHINASARRPLPAEHHIDTEEDQLEFALDNFPTRSVSEALSRVMICETLATESFRRPVILASRSTLPGASPHRSLLVSGTQTTVSI